MRSGQEPWPTPELLRARRQPTAAGAGAACAAERARRTLKRLTSSMPGMVFTPSRLSVFCRRLSSVRAFARIRRQAREVKRAARARRSHWGRVWRKVGTTLTRGRGLVHGLLLPPHTALAAGPHLRLHARELLLVERHLRRAKSGGSCLSGRGSQATSDSAEQATRGVVDRWTHVRPSPRLFPPTYDTGASAGQQRARVLATAGPPRPAAAPRTPGWPRRSADWRHDVLPGRARVPRATRSS